MQYHIPRNRSTIDSYTVEFFHHAIHFSAVTLTYYLKQVATDIVPIIKNLPSTTLPALQASDEVNIVLHMISDLINKLDKIPSIKTMSDTIF